MSSDDLKEDVPLLPLDGVQENTSQNDTIIEATQASSPNSSSRNHTVTPPISSQRSNGREEIMAMPELMEEVKRNSISEDRGSRGIQSLVRDAEAEIAAGDSEPASPMTPDPRGEPTEVSCSLLFLFSHSFFPLVRIGLDFRFLFPSPVYLVSLPPSLFARRSPTSKMFTNRFTQLSSALIIRLPLSLLHPQSQPLLPDFLYLR